MTYNEVIKQIKRLSTSEQQAVYKELKRTLKDAPRNRISKSRKAVSYKPGVFKPNKGSSLFKVLGALREEGKPAPTDNEVEKMIADYLLEKHS